MVIATHIILTGFGHWLPNDPRGSLSCWVWSAALAKLGPRHYGRRKLRPTLPALQAFHRRAAIHLTHPVIWFDHTHRQILAQAFGEVIRKNRYTCFAAAILHNHAHLLIRRHRDPAAAIIGQLKDASTARLRGAPGVPGDHPIWSDDPYGKFLDNAEAIWRTIDYINRNPEKSGLPPQMHDFVTPYRGEWSGGNKRRNRSRPPEGHRSA